MTSNAKEQETETMVKRFVEVLEESIGKRWEFMLAGGQVVVGRLVEVGELVVTVHPESEPIDRGVHIRTEGIVAICEAA